MNIHSLTDHFAVWWRGGVRVRIVLGGPEPEGVSVGGMKGLSGDQALQAVLELKPEGSGVVHIRGGESGFYRVETSGSLGDGFAQRVRNVLGSL